MHAGALAVGLLGVLVIAAALLAQHTSLLGVRHIQVRGASDVSAATIRQAAALTEGTPMTSVDTAQLEQRVVDVPGLESVSVERLWPTTVRINVTERVPVLAVETAAGLVLVDRHGVAFDNLVEPPDTVVLFTPPAQDPEEAVTAAASAVAALPQQIRSEVQMVNATGPRDVHIFLSGGREVVWGDGQKADRKAQVLGALLSVEGTVYDVSVPEVALVR